jgi:hypothetical protein
MIGRAANIFITRRVLPRTSFATEPSARPAEGVSHRDTVLARKRRGPVSDRLFRKGQTGVGMTRLCASQRTVLPLHEAQIAHLLDGWVGGSMSPLHLRTEFTLFQHP